MKLVQSMSDGAFGYMKKPVELEALQLKIKGVKAQYRLEVMS